MDKNVPPPIKPEDIAISVVISVLKNGQVLFHLPNDPIQTFGLLELAKVQMCKNMAALEAESQSRIIKPLKMMN